MGWILHTPSILAIQSIFSNLILYIEDYTLNIVLFVYTTSITCKGWINILKEWSRTTLDYSTSRGKNTDDPSHGILDSQYIPYPNVHLNGHLTYYSVNNIKSKHCIGITIIPALLQISYRKEAVVAILDAYDKETFEVEYLFFWKESKSPPGR